jgi:serine/threonine-protein kinase
MNDRANDDLLPEHASISISLAAARREHAGRLAAALDLDAGLAAILAAEEAATAHAGALGAGMSRAAPSGAPTDGAKAAVSARAIGLGRPGDLMTVVPGTKVADYEIVRLVGSGGMGSVYLARDESLGRVVALKLLAGDEAASVRFVREARAVAAVDHPHIIPVYAAGEAGGIRFIAMRFVPGGTLQEVFSASGALPARRAAGFISPVASALDAAHAADLVHRDVKPANILVDARRGGPEHLYLTDFGIARAMVSTDSLTAAGQFLGTPDYAAPEQIQATQPVDGRADQYALACVAFEALTGSVPFKRDVPIAVLYAHVSAPPPRVASIRRDLPATVDDVFARALAKNPDDRYRSCADFADALREALGLDSYDPSRAVPIPTLPMSMLDGLVPHPARRAPVTWTAVVTADRDYYDHIRAVDERESGEIRFPDDFPERRIPLTGAELLIGRSSKSMGISPEIDLIGPPRDPGVHRMHAKLVPAPDGWTVVDLGMVNGITVNGRDVPKGAAVPLHPGDRIHLGAWTKITITQD